MAWYLNLRAKLGLDTGGFLAGLRTAEGETTKFGAKVKRALAGAFATTAMISAAKQTIEWGGRIKDLSDRLGVAAEDLQRLEYAAKLSGASLDQIVMAITALGKARAEVVRGGAGADELVAILESLGISAEKFKTAGLVESLKEIGGAIGGMEMSDELEGFIQKLLGRGSGDLMAAFKGGLEDSMNAADQLGIVLEAGVIDRLDTIGDQIDTIAAQLRGPVAEAVLVASKGFLAMTNGFRMAGAGLGYWKDLFSKDWLKTMGETGFLGPLARVRDMADRIAHEQDLAEVEAAAPAPRRRQTVNPAMIAARLAAVAKARAKGEKPAAEDKEKELQWPESNVPATVAARGDWLGAVGGTIGGGGREAETARSLRNIDSNMRAIRVRMEGIGIRIDPQGLQ